MKPVVLVVHGDGNIRQDLVDTLSRADLTVLGCASAEEALERLIKESPVHLFVLDVQLPGINGWQFCRLLRLPHFTAYNQTPILMTSTMFSGADAEAISLDVGANAFLPGPFAPGTFVAAVQALLAGRKPEIPQRVLVVDDDVELSRLLQRVFAKHGYLTAGAASCAEARVRFEQQPADIVVLDYHLPDEDADSLIAKFGVGGRSTAIVVITGDPNPHLPVKLMQAGADTVVRKPFRPEEVVDAARKAQRQRATMRTEELLAQGNRQLQLTQFAMEHAAEPVFWVAPDGQLLYANAAFFDAVGYSPADLTNLHFFELDAHLTKADWPERWRQLREQGTRMFETEFRTREGRIFPVEIVANYLAYEHREYGFVSLRDLSERRRLQEQFWQNERLESIGRLAGGVAHDFNNILQSILGFTELLTTSLPPNDTRQRDLNEIQKAAQRAARLTSELLAYSQKQMIEPRLADLNYLITDLQEALRAQLGPHITLHLALSVEPLRSTVDVAQIERVIKTMTRNATEAMPNGGTFTISTDRITLQPSDASLIAEGRQGHFIRIALSDIGCGISRDVIPHIFEPFYSTKGLGQGTGLGLAMAYGVIKQHQGWINVYSEPGHGTTFKIYLPAQSAPATAAKPILSAAAADLTNKRILLVEDESSISDYASRILTQHGYDVRAVSGVREALEVITEEHAGFALLFSDIVLTDGNGIELADQLRAQQPNLQVVLTSGYTDDQTRWPDIARKNYRFLPKPYPAATLLNCITSILTEKKD